MDNLHFFALFGIYKYLSWKHSQTPWEQTPSSEEKGFGVTVGRASMNMRKYRQGPSFDFILGSTNSMLIT
jgi:hypothetical protein